MNRREFLTLIGAGGAMMALPGALSAGTLSDVEPISPHVQFISLSDPSPIAWSAEFDDIGYFTSVLHRHESDRHTWWGMSTFMIYGPDDINIGVATFDVLRNKQRLIDGGVGPGGIYRWESAPWEYGELVLPLIVSMKNLAARKTVTYEIDPARFNLPI